MLPPNDDGKTQKNVTINVYEIVIQHAWLNDMMKDLHIRGHMKVGWQDSRLRWDESEYRLREMSLQTASHVWVPQLASLNSRQDNALSSGDTLAFRRISTTNGGNLSAFFNFNLQGYCDVDLENYPNDLHRCCYQLAPKLYEDITQLRLWTNQLRLDDRHYRRLGWALAASSTRAFRNDEGIASLEFCLTLARASTTLRVELAVPMAICAILVFISPLFGPVQAQLHVKLFALLLQYLCLQYLANKSSHIGLGATTPRIFRFYEFTIAANLASIVASLVISLLARKHRNLPPGYKLSQFAAVFNTLFCCFSSLDDDASVSPTNDPAVDAKKSYKADWAVLWSAVHSALMLALLLFYLIGVLIIYA